MASPEILLSFLLSICLLALLAQRLRVADPIIFLFGGVLLSYVPGMDSFTIDPQTILPLFLPPLLMEAAYFTSLRDFRHNLHSIMQLAIGLVLATAAAVAWVFVSIVPGAGWAAGFVLGAIVSPPDAVAATSIIKKLRVPKRIVTILEGESLINDASGLILYQFAVAAVMTSHFSPLHAGIHFVWMVLGGLGIGLGIAKIYQVFFHHIQELSIEILSNFVVAYLAYLLADAVEASGVLSVVAMGIYIGWHAPTLFPPRFRIPADAVWRMTVFVLGGVVFILLGLHMKLLLTHLSVYSPLTLAYYASAICLTCVAVRFIYVFFTAYGLRFLFPRLRENGRYPPWQNIFIVAYTGMRGVVSLATVLALPSIISWGEEFPQHDLITFLALSLIVFTLVLQGLPLPWLIRKMAFNRDVRLLQEDWEARKAAALSGLRQIEALSAQEDVPKKMIERIKGYYEQRLNALGDGPNTPLVEQDVPAEPAMRSENQIWQEVLSAERHAVVGLRKAYQIGDDVMNDILHDLDLLANRFRA